MEVKGIHTAGKVYITGAGPGDPELITVKGYNALKNCDVIIYDGLVNNQLLQHVPDSAIKIFIGHSRHENRITQDEVNELMIYYASQNKIVVRLKGGDPFIFGRGGEEIIALNDAGIDWEVIPGVSAGIAAPAYAGIPLTHRSVSSSVAFITGHECNSQNPKTDLKKIASSVNTLVIFMGIKNLESIANDLMDAGLPKSTPVAIVERGTMPGQKVVTGTLEDIRSFSREINSPALIIIGEVVKLREAILADKILQTIEDSDEILSCIY